ncbi:MAG: adenosylmethionine decarboxylase [Polyangiaceae bacterium]|nr:adenosylmethionine decarboxylase [Polyangiaceae bacterium]
MRLTVGLAIFEDIAAGVLDDEAAIKAALERAIEAGGFTLYDLRLVRFSPQGITGAAIVGESHLTIHTWPEERKLFVDVASCGDPAGVDRALDAIEKALPGARMSEVEVRTLGHSPP